MTQAQKDILSPGDLLEFFLDGVSVLYMVLTRRGSWVKAINPESGFHLNLDPEWLLSPHWMAVTQRRDNEIQAVFPPNSGGLRGKKKN